MRLDGRVAVVTGASSGIGRAIALRFEGGGVGAVEIAWTRDELPGRYSLDVLGSDSSLHLELDPAFTLSGRSRGATVEAPMDGHPMDRTLARFIDAARSGDRGAVFCTPSQAAGTLAVVLACEEAVASARGPRGWRTASGWAA